MGRGLAQAMLGELMLVRVQPRACLVNHLVKTRPKPPTYRCRCFGISHSVMLFPQETAPGLWPRACRKKDRPCLSTLNPLNSLTRVFKPSLTMPAKTPSHFEKVAMTISSGASDETYGWIASIPGMREWIGQRQIKNLTASKYTIANKLFESTVSVKRTSMEDDRLGVYKPAFAELGSLSQRHPDTMIFSLMKSGFAANCYDGQFFDTDHPVVDENGDTVQVANTDGGWVRLGSCWIHRGQCAR